MAINIHSASALATFVDAKSSSFFLPNSRHSNLYLAISSPKPNIGFPSKCISGIRCNVTAKARLSKVGVVGSLEAPAVLDTKSGGASAEEIENETNSSSVALASEESISEFITQVTNLIKLVDSRDIVELQMKQLDCEILIRKKKAMAPLIPPTPVNMVLPQPQLSVPPQVTAPAPSPASLPPPPKPDKSSLPSVKSPMAGTFYRNPAPGAPPFVKVGDKVQKGQVLCIVEAMKLMNEIEADQSGTIVEVLAEDTKPVSFDTPLFLIQPQ